MKSVKFNKNELKILCAQHEVKNLSLFGSVVTEKFHKESDIDVLVNFKIKDLYNYFNNYLSLKEKLSKLFGRKVDLVEEQTLKSPILINSIKKTKQIVFLS